MNSNIDVYLAITEEAFAEMNRLLSASRTPKPSGEPGYIISFDPDRRSFKKALIVIAFAAMYLEALLYILALKQYGREEALKIDRLPYEQRMARLGINDQDLLDSAKEFRNARKELIHDKAIEISEVRGTTIRLAQTVAAEAVNLIHQVRQLLGNGL